MVEKRGPALEPVLGGAQGLTLSDGEEQLRLICTPDLHMHFMPFDYYSDQADDRGGLGRAGRNVRAARAGGGTASPFPSSP